MKKNCSPLISIALTHACAVLIIAMCFILPRYAGRVFEEDGRTVLISYYICVPAALFATYLLSKFLNSVRRSNVFTMTNLLRVKLLSWCCMYVAAEAGIAGFFYVPMVIISVLALFLCIILRVIKSVFADAVEMKKESELTI